MTSFDVKRKRPRWIGWIPAVILTLMVVGVGVASAALMDNGLGGPAPRPTVGEVTELNWSSFTDDGLAYIERSRDVRIDLSRLPTDAAALGLAAEGTTTIGPSDNLDTDNDYYLIVSGGGEGFGGKKFTVSQLDITTTGGEISRIIARSSDTLTFRLALSTLEAQAEEFGWPPLDTDAIFASVGAPVAAGEPFGFTVGPGGRLGMDVAAGVTCQPTGFCSVEYEVTPAVR